MHQPLYREILRQAWHLTWHQRLLWVLGLFSAVLVSGGAFDVLARNISWSLQPNFGFMSASWWRWGDWELGLAASLWLIALGLLLLGLAAFVVFVMIRSFISLILGAGEYKVGEKLDLEKLWHEGHGHFWPVLGTIVLARVLIMILSGLTLLPLFLLILDKWNLFSSIIYPPIFLIGVVAGVVVNFLMIFISVFLVLEKYDWKKAAASAWRLFLINWLVSLEMALVMFAIYLLVGLVLAVGAIIIMIPVIATVIFARFIMLPGLGSIAVFVGSLLAVCLILLVAGFLSTFHVGSWVLLVERMKKETAVSKLVRLVEHVKSKFKK